MTARAVCPRTSARTSVVLGFLIMLLPSLPTLAAFGRSVSPVETDEAAAPARRTFQETIAGSTVSFELVQLPPGKLLVQGDKLGELVEHHIGPIWMSSTEVTWDAYDLFVFGLDRKSGISSKDDPEALSRPTKPYISADRGFGHAGYPAISISHRGAEAYCEWLTGKTGRKYRLPTAAEWEYGCRAGSTGTWSCGDDEAGLLAIAWFRNNSNRQTQPVGSKQANAFGLFDMHGNAAEWANGPSGEKSLHGGSYQDRAYSLRCVSQRFDSPDLNAGDPQLPKSIWWLVDGPHIGFRVVCEQVPEAEQDQ